MIVPPGRSALGTVVPYTQRRNLQGTLWELAETLTHPLPHERVDWCRERGR